MFPFLATGRFSLASLHTAHSAYPRDARHATMYYSLHSLPSLTRHGVHASHICGQCTRVLSADRPVSRPSACLLAYLSTCLPVCLSVCLSASVLSFTHQTLSSSPYDRRHSFVAVFEHTLSTRTNHFVAVSRSFCRLQFAKCIRVPLSTLHESRTSVSELLSANSLPTTTRGDADRN